MVPKPYCAVRGAGSELREILLELTLLHRLDAKKAQLLVVLHWLNVVDGAAMGHERPIHRYLIELFDVPNEHHPIRVKSDCSLICFVDVAGYYVGKFRFFSLWDFDLADA